VSGRGARPDEISGVAFYAARSVGRQSSEARALSALSVPRHAQPPADHREDGTRQRGLSQVSRTPTSRLGYAPGIISRMDKRTEGLQKKRLTLFLAASDMDQAAAAAEALDAEKENVNLMRALETAIATCYARPFTDSSLVNRLKASKWVAPTDRGLHDFLMDGRKKVYAHTDVESGRSAGPRQVTTVDGDVVTIGYREGWWSFPRELIPQLLDMCRKQAQCLRNEGLRIETELATAQAGNASQN
jgi:hypothetical protein